MPLCQISCCSPSTVPPAHPLDYTTAMACCLAQAGTGHIAPYSHYSTYTYAATCSKHQHQPQQGYAPRDSTSVHAWCAPQHHMAPYSQLGQQDACVAGTPAGWHSQVHLRCRRDARERGQKLPTPLYLAQAWGVECPQPTMDCSTAAISRYACRCMCSCTSLHLCHTEAKPQHTHCTVSTHHIVPCR